MTFKDLDPNELTEAEQVAGIADGKIHISRITNPSEEVQLAAVTDYWGDLVHIKNPSYNVCLTAIRKNGHAIEYVENQTEELCLIAVSVTSPSIIKIRNQSRAVQMKVIRKNPYYAMYCKRPPTDVVEYALELEPKLVYHFHGHRASHGKTYVPYDGPY